MASDMGADESVNCWHTTLGLYKNVDAFYCSARSIARTTILGKVLICNVLVMLRAYRRAGLSPLAVS